MNRKHKKGIVKILIAAPNSWIFKEKFFLFNTKFSKKINFFSSINNEFRKKNSFFFSRQTIIDIDINFDNNSRARIRI